MLEVLAYPQRRSALGALPYAARLRTLTSSASQSFGFNPHQLRWPKGSPNRWGGRWMAAPWKIGSDLLDWLDSRSPWGGQEPAALGTIRSQVAAMNDAGIDTTGESLWGGISTTLKSLREALGAPGIDADVAERMADAELRLGRWADQGPEALDMVLEDARWLRDTGDLSVDAPTRLDATALDLSWLGAPIDDYDLDWLMRDVVAPDGTARPGSAADGISSGHFTRERQQEYRRIAEAILGQTYAARRPGGTPEPPLLDRKATVLGGGAGSGKSSLLKLDDMAGARDGAAQIGGDEVRVNLTSYARIAEDFPLEAAAVAHAESMVVTDRLMETAQKAGIKFVADQTSSGNVRVLRRQIDELHENGYEVDGAFAFADPHEAWVRSLIRGVKKGRFMPYSALLESHRGAARNFNELLDASDTASVRDTSGASPRLVATKAKGGELQILDEEAWERFVTTGERAGEQRMSYNDFVRIAQAAIAGGHRIPPSIYTMAIDAGVNLPDILDELKKGRGGSGAD